MKEATSYTNDELAALESAINKDIVSLAAFNRAHVFFNQSDPGLRYE